MPDIKLKNQNGIETTYEGINSIKVPNTNGEYEEFFTASYALGTINTWLSNSNGTESSGVDVTYTITPETCPIASEITAIRVLVRNRGLFYENKRLVRANFPKCTYAVTYAFGLCTNLADYTDEEGNVTPGLILGSKGTKFSNPGMHFIAQVPCTVRLYCDPTESWVTNNYTYSKGSGKIEFYDYTTGEWHHTIDIDNGSSVITNPNI